ncbi:chromatin modification-related protein MEAF6 isoform X1 [Telopea speciosissima]|uniref:chromatin modification-related protein MEAF6 isoform X1 n=1 Tax=Telopea speciosissima TaxID=54955 RepID=UPI001CC7C051|nr:chromatin modification-related protein MEAF6 isoform X1 [Telopea speciosissima]
MESDGQRASSNPSAMLASLMSKREKLHLELRNIEKQVYELETSYLQDSNQCGNVLKGFEWFLSSSKSTTNLKRSRKFQPEDRLFSLSSVTSPAADEQLVGRDGMSFLSFVLLDGRSDFGPRRSKGGGTPANGQGKPKKGRTAPRDGKRFRPSSEHDLDEEDDPDLSLM